MDDIAEGNVLFISEKSTDDYKDKFKSKVAVITYTLNNFVQKQDFQLAFYSAVITTYKAESLCDSKLLEKVLSVLKPGSLFIIWDNAIENDKIELLLKTSGFISITSRNHELISQKPKYEIGSSAKLKLNLKPANAVWKLDDAIDEEVDMIDPDNLLDEDDLKKPDPTSLKVCATTGKRKACKDCSCGLADELNAEVKGVSMDLPDAPKSSCGSCYLGDAFRCATCPYMGMPAFKPGEKIQLSDGQLKADI